MAPLPNSAGDRPSGARASAASRRRKPLIRTDPAADRKPELTEQIVTEVKRDLPGVLVSLGLHGVVLLLLALIPILLEPPPPIGAIDLEWATAARARPTLPPPEVQVTAPIQLSRPTPPPAVRQPPPSPTPPAAPAVSEEIPPQPVSALGSLDARTDQDLERLASRDGFNPDARQAIDRGLRWLARQQHADGHWSLDGPYADGVSRTRWSTNVGATGLALLALLGDGHTHQRGEYAAVVAKGVQWLRSAQRPSGEIYDGATEGEEPSIYSHAISTIVLGETLALTGDAEYREATERAVEFLLRAQNPVQGGWRYRPLSDTGEGDLSVTGWALMALHTARMAGLDVSPEAYLLADNFLNRCQERPGDAAFYKYTPGYPADRMQRVGMTASGLLARQWLGWPRQHPPLIRGVDYLLSDEARPDWENGRRNVYAWYYQAEVLHNMGGERWKEWFSRTQQLLISRQQTSGKEAGSWHPTRPPGSKHEFGDVVGRLYVTVMCLLILETPYRHAPLYEAAAP